MMNTATANRKEYGKNPIHRGVYFLEEASAKGLAFVSAKVEDTKIFLLVDPEEETVVNAKFFTYGGPDSIALGEAICDMAEGVSFKEVASTHGEKVIKLLNESNYYPFDSEKTSSIVERMISALREEYPLALAKLSISTAKKAHRESSGSVKDEKWLALPKQEQIKLINAAIDGQMREALQVDGGDIEIVDIRNGWDVHAEFQGACSSCSASMGSTFIVVENIIKAKVNDRLSLVANGFLW